LNGTKELIALRVHKTAFLRGAQVGDTNLKGGGSARKRQANPRFFDTLQSRYQTDTLVERAVSRETTLRSRLQEVA